MVKLVRKKHRPSPGGSRGRISEDDAECLEKLLPLSECVEKAFNWAPLRLRRDYLARLVDSTMNEEVALAYFRRRNEHHGGGNILSGDLWNNVLIRDAGIIREYVLNGARCLRFRDFLEWCAEMSFPIPEVYSDVVVRVRPKLFAASLVDDAERDCGAVELHLTGTLAAISEDERLFLSGLVQEFFGRVDFRSPKDRILVKLGLDLERGSRERQEYETYCQRKKRQGLRPPPEEHFKVFGSVEYDIVRKAAVSREIEGILDSTYDDYWVLPTDFARWMQAKGFPIHRHLRDLLPTRTEASMVRGDGIKEQAPMSPNGEGRTGKGGSWIGAKTWADITFLPHNDPDKVKVRVKGKRSEQITAAQLKMLDNRTKNPNAAFEFLRKIVSAEGGKMIVAQDFCMSPATFRQNIKRLNEALCAVFGIDGVPIDNTQTVARRWRGDNPDRPAPKDMRGGQYWRIFRLESDVDSTLPGKEWDLNT